MSRLLTVVNERKKIRNEYRAHLEDEYIAEKKAEEKAQFEEELMARRERGEETELTPHEIGQKLREAHRKKIEQYQEVTEELLERFDGASPSERAQEKWAAQGQSPRLRAPLLVEEDMLMLAQGRVKLSQKDILKMHVKNYAELDLKQRRKVMGHIQAQRAMHAKEVFLKELATIGSQYKAQKAQR